jgi:hypothetical protein
LKASTAVFLRFFFTALHQLRFSLPSLLCSLFVLASRAPFDSSPLRSIGTLLRHSSPASHPFLSGSFAPHTIASQPSPRHFSPRNVCFSSLQQEAEE